MGWKNGSVLHLSFGPFNHQKGKGHSCHSRDSDARVPWLFWNPSAGMGDAEGGLGAGFWCFLGVHPLTDFFPVTTLMFVLLQEKPVIMLLCLTLSSCGMFWNLFSLFNSYSSVTRLNILPFTDFQSQISHCCLALHPSATKENWSFHSELVHNASVHCFWLLNSLWKLFQ